MSEVWRQKLDGLPQAPGVYVFKTADGTVLYVGKASSLRNRVRSYFQAGTSDQRYFIERLERELGDIETFVTASEKEAALLENGLIKQYKPRYNFKLRDDKEYLSLRLDEKMPWARLEVVRRPKQDGARYFGPYHSATSARATLRVVNRHFQLRTCTDTEMKARTRPCLQYQIKRCLAPCVYDVDKAEYTAQARNVGLFLEGRHDELVNHLQRAMYEASSQLKYEVAATYRDQIRAVDSAREAQRVAIVRDADQDVFGYFRQADKVELAVLMVRHGRVTGVRTFDLRDVRLPDDELIAGFVAEYYHLGSFVPDEVLIPTEIEGQAGFAEVLSEQRGGKVSLTRPQRGSKAQLLRMAMENAAHAFREKARAQEDLETRLRTIAERLGLPKLPRRFECIDVSHTSGKETVAAIVAFRDGEPDRKHYRSFHIRSVSGGDDYGAMREALTRRFKRGKANEAGWELPDLLVVDGGRGQLGIAQAVLAELELTGLPVAALAKEKQNALGAELVDRVYTPGRLNPVEVRSAMNALGILSQARDEAHRVSNALRIRLGKGQRLRTQLDDIPFIGKKTRIALLKKLGSMEAVSAASVEQLQASGATLRQARAIVEHLSRAAPTAEGSEEDALENAFDAGDPQIASEGNEEQLEAAVEFDALATDEEQAGGDVAAHENASLTPDSPQPGSDTVH
ncbi:MAG TPA: excinuclease ABC subunit UvrC [Polyangiales bacterium]|nr:excinuclease ABC subunit UvrC [Polyangiales bacterium]